MSAPEPDDRFLALLEEHRRILYKVANAYCRTVEDRRDLVQEIVVQLWRSFPRFDDRVRFSTWVYRIALNVAISFYRSESRWTRHRELVDEPSLEILAVDGEWTDDSSDEIRQLHDCIAELDALNRALIILYLDGNSHEAIGEILGISTTNVGTRIGRIKEKFRRESERVRPSRTGGRHGNR